MKKRLPPPSIQEAIALKREEITTRHAAEMAEFEELEIRAMKLFGQATPAPYHSNGVAENVSFQSRPRRAIGEKITVALRPRRKAAAAAPRATGTITWEQVKAQLVAVGRDGVTKADIASTLGCDIKRVENIITNGGRAEIEPCGDKRWRLKGAKTVAALQTSRPSLPSVKRQDHNFGAPAREPKLIVSLREACSRLGKNGQTFTREQLTEDVKTHAPQFDAKQLYQIGASLIRMLESGELTRTGAGSNAQYSIGRPKLPTGNGVSQKEKDYLALRGEMKIEVPRELDAEAPAD